MKLFGRKKKQDDKTEYEQLRDDHAEYREACKELEKQFVAWDKRVGAMNKDAEKAAASLNKAAALCGLNCISGETITAQEAKLQAKIDQGKQMIKDVITENSETRKMIDDREKADKVMTSKEATAEKAEKKSDEKAPQYRDEANKAAEDFRLLDGQLMDRLRLWQKSRAEVFRKIVAIMSDVLTAPNTVGGGGGGNVPAISVASSSSTAQKVASPRESARSANVVSVPRDLETVSKPDLEMLSGKVRDQLAKARKEKEELQKMADMYSKTKDPDLHSKAMSEVSAVTAEVSVLEADLKRLEKALQPPPQVLAVTSPSKSGEVRARALYDFVAEREEELSLKAGDIVVVVDDSDVDGWWEAMKDGVTGFCPGSYLKKEE